MRSLSPEEEELWAKVASTIRPLSRDPLAPPGKQPPRRAAPPAPPRERIAATAPRPSAAPLAQAGLADLDSHWDRRLRSGSVEPDRVVDLHDHTLDRAWEAIDRGLERAIQSGERVILLITGRSRPGVNPPERGKIRASVNDWLAVSRHARDIAAVRGAHRRHGGAGSLYIILRRPRARSTIC